MLMRNEYFFLSNMYPCQIKYNGHTFQSIEAAFQAQKDLSRISEFEGISGKDAKRLGRKVNLRPDWESVKLGIMEDLLRVKFSDTELARKLKAVNEPIVEDNTWHDTYWGVCEGKGQNNLGKLLTKIKGDLQKEENGAARDKTLVVLGGSFKPPTKAHIKLLESTVEQLNADFGIFVPASENYVARKITRHGGKDKLYSEETRLSMLNAICEKHPKLKVSTCEYGDDGRGHTYDTLCKIQKEYPGYKVLFVVGADKVYQLPKWHHSDAFFENFEFAVTKRNDIDINKVIANNPMLTKYKDSFHEVTVDKDISGISSTKARQLIAERNFGQLEQIMSPETIQFI